MAQGNQEDSDIAEAGFASGRSLQLRATGRGDTGANRIRTKLSSTIPAGRIATLRARVRWLAGNPEFLMRLRGNWLEATTNILAARNLGTPGARNSRAAGNAGPSIDEVQHNPVFPRAGQPVRVTARVEDPNQLVFPGDDLLLGETDVSMSWPRNGGGDNSYQREQTAYWIADRLGLPYMYRRHVNLFVNGTRRAAYFEDVQQPNGHLVDAWYPDGKNGDLHKVHPRT